MINFFHLCTFVLTISPEKTDKKRFSELILVVKINNKNQHGKEGKQNLICFPDLKKWKKNLDTISKVHSKSLETLCKLVRSFLENQFGDFPYFFFLCICFTIEDTFLLFAGHCIRRLIFLPRTSRRQSYKIKLV